MPSSFLGMYWFEGLRGDGIGSIGVGCNGSKGRLGSICKLPTCLKECFDSFPIAYWICAGS